MNKKVFVILPVSLDFCYIADRHPFFVDDYGKYKFNSKDEAINSLVDWGLGSRNDIIEYFSKGNIKLVERDDFTYFNDMRDF